jgi:hypothetical protein
MRYEEMHKINLATKKRIRNAPITTTAKHAVFQLLDEKLTIKELALYLGKSPNKPLSISQVRKIITELYKQKWLMREGKYYYIKYYITKENPDRPKDQIDKKQRIKIPLKKITQSKNSAPKIPLKKITQSKNSAPKIPLKKINPVPKKVSKTDPERTKTKQSLTEHYSLQSQRRGYVSTIKPVKIINKSFPEAPLASSTLPTTYGVTKIIDHRIPEGNSRRCNLSLTNTNNNNINNNLINKIKNINSKTARARSIATGVGTTSGKLDPVCIKDQTDNQDQIGLSEDHVRELETNSTAEAIINFRTRENDTTNQDGSGLLDLAEKEKTQEQDQKTSSLENGLTKSDQLLQEMLRAAQVFKTGGQDQNGNNGLGGGQDLWPGRRSDCRRSDRIDHESNIDRDKIQPRPGELGIVAVEVPGFGTIEVDERDYLDEEFSETASRKTRSYDDENLAPCAEMDLEQNIASVVRTIDEMQWGRDTDYNDLEDQQNQSLEGSEEDQFDDLSGGLARERKSPTVLHLPASNRLSRVPAAVKCAAIQADLLEIRRRAVLEKETARAGPAMCL